MKLSNIKKQGKTVGKNIQSLNVLQGNLKIFNIHEIEILEPSERENKGKMVIVQFPPNYLNI